ncbi:hypothetical protein MKEN_00223700 [Mycena kentingensis (nom. inval.)]|nr:hypothetical protein MKEN_00223700 [Mycena kentingensis (nom. inval.)]
MVGNAVALLPDMLLLPSVLVLRVLGAPLSTPHTRAITPQFCTGPLGTGTCSPLNGSECTNTPGIQTLLLNAETQCAGWKLPDCEAAGINDGAYEIYSNTALAGLTVQSVECDEFPGTVNGWTRGSPQDIGEQREDVLQALMFGNISLAFASI